MGFDQDAWEAEHRRWTYTTRGRTYVARDVSVPAVQRCFAAIARGEAADVERELRRLLRLAFPWRPSFWWRGDPVALLMGLNPATRQAALADFFASLRGAATPPAPPTPGSS